MNAQLLGSAAVLAVSGWLLVTYVKLGRMTRRRDAAFARLADALHDRQELTRELVALCAEFLNQDTALIEAVALSRSYAMQARTVLARTKTETDLCWALARLLLTAQANETLANHPDYLDTCAELVASEDRAAAAKSDYNDQVTKLELALEHPMEGVVGWLFHITPGDLFELDPKIAREAMMTLLSPAENRLPPQRTVDALASVAFTS